VSEHGRANFVRLCGIFLPALGLSVAMVCGYSALDSLLVARSDLIPLDEIVATYWLPLAISWLLTILLVHPALDLFRRRTSLLADFHRLAAVAVVAVPTLIAQSYIAAATGELTRVQTPADIITHPPTRFYAMDAPCIDRSRAVFDSAMDTNDVEIRRLRFVAYAAAPLCDRSDIWVGFTFEESRPDPRWSANRRAQAAAFLTAARVELLRTDARDFRYFERRGRNSDRRMFAKMLRQVGADVAAPSSVLLIPHRERFEERTGDRLAWAFGSFGIAAVSWLALAFVRPLAPDRATRWLADRGRRAQASSALAGDGNSPWRRYLRRL
jgi:hypothetical protein